MVYQSEIIQFITEKFINGTVLTVEYGESTIVDYQDNALDSVHATITDGTKTIIDNQVRINSVLDTGDANGNDVDATLTKIDGYSANKTLFTSIAKTSAKIIDVYETYLFYVEN